MSHLPAWMALRATAEGWRDTPLPAARRRPRFARRALDNFARLAGILLESAGDDPGVLGRLDPRAKVLGFIWLIVAMTFVHAPATLAIALAGVAAVVVLCRVPLTRLLPVLLGVTAVTTVIMLPAILNVVTPGETLWTLSILDGARLGPWTLPETLTVTSDGLLVAARVLLRTTVCVALALLLTTTTRSSRLWHGLRALGVPQLFVWLLAVMERYLVVLARVAAEIHLAKLSRVWGAVSLRREQAWAAAGMGELFRNARRLGDDVYLAMLARGYTGEPRLLEASRWQGAEWALLSACLLVGSLLVWAG